MAVVCAAFAADFSNGKVGGYATPDSPTDQGKSINIQKEITAYNPETTIVYGPAINYTYTMVPASGTELVTVTDATTDHTSGQAVTATVLPGVTTGVTVNGGTAGTAASASGTLAWTNADILNASPDGIANIKKFAVSFTNVVFTQPGVYRYKITETVADYTTSGVTAGSDQSHIRYLDVYVMRSGTYNDGSTAGDWTIYGYVCISNGTANITTATAKTSGFVDSSAASDPSSADAYHTYNLTIGKTLTGDATMNNNKFPFDAAWTAGSATGTFQFIVETTGTVQVTKTDVAAAATGTVNGTEAAAHMKVGGASEVDTADKDGTPSIASGGTIKYIGIPCGTMVTVTETNNVTGTTYTTTATEKIGAGSAAAVAFDDASTATLSTDKKVATAAQTKTVVYAQASAPANDSNVEIQYTNVLAMISPTGYVTRFAPYALMLVGGIALLIVAKKHKKHSDEEE